MNLVSFDLQFFELGLLLVCGEEILVILDFLVACRLDRNCDLCPTMLMLINERSVIYMLLTCLAHG